MTALTPGLIVCVKLNSIRYKLYKKPFLEHSKALLRMTPLCTTPPMIYRLEGLDPEGFELFLKFVYPS